MPCADANAAGLTPSRVVVIDGNRLDRVLHVHAGATVTLTAVTIRQGRAPDGAYGGEGPGGDGRRIAPTTTAGGTSTWHLDLSLLIDFLLHTTDSEISANQILTISQQSILD